MSAGASGNIDIVLYGKYEDKPPSSVVCQSVGYASVLQSKSRENRQMSDTQLKTKTDRKYAVNKEEILPLKDTKLE